MSHPSKDSPKRVFAANISDLRAQLSEALEFTGFRDHVRRDTRVFLKPNLTWKEHLPGVTVTPGRCSFQVRFGFRKTRVSRRTWSLKPVYSSASDSWARRSEILAAKTRLGLSFDGWDIELANPWHFIDRSHLRFRLFLSAG